jgi:hypothetical protein
LTALPNKIPTDGSTITVWIDGIPQPGHPVYNQYREDIATLFPSYNNSDGAVGYYYLDTAAFADGLHTISWSVRDDAGNEGGTGSIYFRTSNGQQRESETAFTGMVNAVIPRHLHTSLMPVSLERGYGTKTGRRFLYPDNEGIITITVYEGERIGIGLSNKKTPETVTGYLVCRDKERNLPVGSFLEKSSGIFYWQPGPGFVGQYRLEFITKDGKGHWAKKNIRVVITPSGTEGL